MGVWRYVKNYTDARRYDNLLTDLSFGSIIIINSFANVDFDRIERWLASKIIFVPIYISKFPNLLRRKHHIFKAGLIPFAIVRFIYLFHSRFSDFESFDRTYFHRPDGTIGTMIISIN